MLAWTIYSSFIGVAVLMLLPRNNARLARIFAMLAAVFGLAVTLLAAFSFKRGEIQTVALVPWIPSLGIEYRLAADGISLTLVLLTGLAAIAGILFSWNIEHRAKEFFAFYLALIGGVYGVFLSFDLFLLFVFYEIAIIPKYFIIAIWGSTRKEYGAMKLALYSFVGSAMVLIGLVAAYVVAGSKTMSLLELAKFPFPPSFQLWAFPLVFVGFAILAGLWPFRRTGCRSRSCIGRPSVDLHPLLQPSLDSVEFCRRVLRPVRSLLAGCLVRGAGDWRAVSRGLLRRAASASFSRSTNQ